MKTTSIAALKARLSEYLNAVKSGEEVLVTDRGTPVARLIPVTGAEREDSRMAGLVRAGLVRPPRERLRKEFWRLPRPKDPNARVLEALIEERAQSR